MPQLSAEEIRRFHEDGFLVPAYQLAREVLEEIREAYDELLASNPGLSSDLLLGPHLEKSGAQGVKGSRRWLEFASRPEILDMVAQLIGEDIILWGTTIFGKPAEHGKATPWHQDGAYYPIRPLETLSVWIALDDAGPDNGCMRFIPGSHKTREIASHHWGPEKKSRFPREMGMVGPHLCQLGGAGPRGADSPGIVSAFRCCFLTSFLTSA